MSIYSWCNFWHFILHVILTIVWVTCTENPAQMYPGAPVSRGVCGSFCANVTNRQLGTCLKSPAPAYPNREGQRGGGIYISVTCRDVRDGPVFGCCALKVSTVYIYTRASISQILLYE